MVRLNEVNMMYLFLHDYKYKSYTVRDMEPYLKFVLQNHHFKISADGSLQSQIDEYDDVFRECREQDFKEDEVNFWQYN